MIKHINENILDQQKDTLNPKIWDNISLKKEVKKQIFGILYEAGIFSEYDVEEVYFIGSSTGYSWTDQSDIDIHVGINGIKKDEENLIFDRLPKNITLIGSNNPIQFFVHEGKEDIQNKDSVYDLLNDSWVIIPKKDNFKIPYNEIINISKMIISAIDNRIQDYIMDKIELDLIRDHLISEDNKEFYEDKIKDLKDDIKTDLDGIYMMNEMLYASRTSSYSKSMFGFGSGNKSVETLVYKVLQKSGYEDKIKTYLAIRKNLNEK